MKQKKIFIYLLWFLQSLMGIAHPALAAEEPAPGLLDARLRTLIYNPLQVYRLRAYDGYQIMLEFGLDEKIQNVALGDSMSWQITPNKAGNLMFLKPVVLPGTTNMAVITDKRRYHFELVAVEGQPTSAQDLIFNVRFNYPAPLKEETEVEAVDSEKSNVETPAPVSSQQDPVAALLAENRSLNLNYRYKGDDTLLPDRIFDDGISTYLHWPREQTLPAIFLVDGRKKESVINFAVQGDYVVLDRIAPVFVLRNGRDETYIYNRPLYGKKKGHEIPQTPLPAQAASTSGDNL
ncbi:P-type conjugative transfer protein VirB9 [Emcibacter nanhaiensis]|uniref:P-type conjugative transfer protein VirB9 n=1 Tax=Emcibacter nanhaiensis TaxID=1505037 RepID=A0A501PJL3_9PROT|nr:P-type conjugative transfer protein VirB9 [Emcibacter nanhaiensis]TPD60222.1 P-type conjugative transfer protein VirB9 [Emcibacter nanhaiensis]